MIGSDGLKENNLPTLPDFVSLEPGLSENRLEKGNVIGYLDATQ